jgi:hypothetical protein
MRIRVKPEHLIKVREDYGLSVNHAASLIGVSGRQWRHYESQDSSSSMPSERAYKLYKILNEHIPIDAFSKPNIGFTSPNGGVGLTSIIDDLAFSYASTGSNPIISRHREEDCNYFNECLEDLNHPSITQCAFDHNERQIKPIVDGDVILTDLGRPDKIRNTFDLLIYVISIDRRANYKSIKEALHGQSSAPRYGGYLNIRALIVDDSIPNFDEICYHGLNSLDDDIVMEQSEVIIERLAEKHLIRKNRIAEIPFRHLPVALNKAYLPYEKKYHENLLNDDAHRMSRAIDPSDSHGMQIKALRMAIEETLYLI